MSETGGCLEESGGGRFALLCDMTFHTVNDILAASEERFADHASVVVDMKNVTDADSAGLALLLEWRSWARHNGRKLTFENIPAQLLAIAEISEIESLLTSRQDNVSGAN